MQGYTKLTYAEARIALGDSQGQKESNRPNATTERLPMAGATRQPARCKLAFRRGCFRSAK